MTPQMHRVGDVTFDRTWAEYKAGFGLAGGTGDGWIGNDRLNQLCPPVNKHAQPKRCVIKDVMTFRVRSQGET